MRLVTYENRSERRQRMIRTRMLYTHTLAELDGVYRVYYSESRGPLNAETYISARAEAGPSLGLLREINKYVYTRGRCRYSRKSLSIVNER